MCCAAHRRHCTEPAQLAAKRGQGSRASRRKLACDECAAVDGENDAIRWGSQTAFSLPHEINRRTGQVVIPEVRPVPQSRFGYRQALHDLHGFTREDLEVRMAFEQLGGCLV